MQFQDRPCADVPSASPARSEALGPSRRAPPLGIDPSWFERPAGSARAVLCDERGCECGPFERPFEAGIETAVAEALYLDGSWHRYEASAAALAAADAADAALARDELDAAACDVLMSQQTLRRYAERAARDLRRRAADAVDLGRDTPAACDGFSDTACAHYEALQLHRRVDADARALGAPRDALLADGDDPDGFDRY